MEIYSCQFLPYSDWLETRPSILQWKKSVLKYKYTRVQTKYTTRCFIQKKIFLKQLKIDFGISRSFNFENLWRKKNSQSEHCFIELCFSTRQYLTFDQKEFQWFTVEQGAWWDLWAGAAIFPPDRLLQSTICQSKKKIKFTYWNKFCVSELILHTDSVDILCVDEFLMIYSLNQSLIKQGLLNHNNNHDHVP